MKIWNNLFSKNDKLHSDVIATSEQGNKSLLTEKTNGLDRFNELLKLR